MGQVYAGVRELRRRLGLPFFDGAWDLNLVILRGRRVGRWNGRIVLACTDDVGREVERVYRCSGSAWEGEWLNPTHPDGCVYVLDQHVPGGYRLGTHKGRPALVQVRDFLNVRWPTSEQRLPTTDELEALGVTQSFHANRGTNLHNRVSDRVPELPDADSTEGCVLTMYQDQHAALIELVQVQDRRLGTSAVSPTFSRLSLWRQILADLA